MNAREAAFDVLVGFQINKGNLEKMIDRTFSDVDRKNPSLVSDTRDKRLAFEIIYGVLRQKTRIDHTIDTFLNDALRQEEKLRIALQIGIYQIIFLDKIPVHAAVNESVNLLKKYSDTRKFSGVANAVLRKISINKKSALVQARNLPLEQELCVLYSHPEWLVSRWLGNFGGTKTRKLLEYNNTPPTIYIRRNGRLTQQKRFESDIASMSLTAPIATGFAKLYYKLKPGIYAPDMESFKVGHCTVQAPSSGWVIALMGIRNGASILEMCAAPGGKTTLIAECAPDSEIYAIDVDFSRVMRISETIHRMAIKNVIPIVTDCEKMGITGQFDYVLLDAPCTGTGVINHHPESRWIRKEESIEFAVERQKKLLETAASCVALGGVLVYSTCSLEREENAAMVESFLEEHQEFHLVSARDYIPESRYVTLQGYLSITPQEHGLDGIFAARLERIS